MSSVAAIRYRDTKFIKISNNRNSERDFYIDITTMKDPRARVGALKTQFKNWNESGDLFKPVFHYFMCDYSFYVLDRGCFNSHEEVKEHRDKLYLEQWKKMNKGKIKGYKHFIDLRR